MIAISVAFVPMSGAGTYIPWRNSSDTMCTYSLMTAVFSKRVSFFGSSAMPLLPPPNGMRVSAVFHTIRSARSRVSSIVTSGAMRIPPFAGPRTVL